MTELFAGWDELILAFVIFFLSHIIPARPAIREWLIRHIGKTLYFGTYSALSIFLFGWLIAAAGRAPHVSCGNFLLGKCGSRMSRCPSLVCCLHSA